MRPQFLPPRTHLALLIADESVEFLAFQAQKVIPRCQNATFGGNGPGCVDVVSCHHSDSNTSSFAFGNSFWYLWRVSKEEEEVGLVMLITAPVQLSLHCVQEKHLRSSAMGHRVSLVIFTLPGATSLLSYS